MPEIRGFGKQISCIPKYWHHSDTFIYVIYLLFSCEAPVSGVRNQRSCVISATGRQKEAIAQLHMGVSKNRGTPKWMVYNGKPY